MELEQAILVRKDLNLSPGKLASQVAHASVECAMKTDNMLLRDWHSRGAKKVVLKVDNDGELPKYKQLAENNNVKTSLITETGSDEIEEGTETCLGIGPDQKEKIDKIIEGLERY